MTQKLKEYKKLLKQAKVMKVLPASVVLPDMQVEDLDIDWNDWCPALVEASRFIGPEWTDEENELLSFLDDDDVFLDIEN